MIELRTTEQIQRHHWQAAVWFRESFLVGAPIVDVVKHACKDFELSFRSPGFDSFSILKRAVHGDAIPSNEKVVGVLREVLNIVWRIAGQKS